MTLTPQLIQEANVSEQLASTEGVTHIGPGAQLKTAREARRLSIEDVANRLHLTRTMIVDIENDKYEQRLAFTFIRGYLRSYARLVRISPEMIVNAFDLLGLKESRLEMNSSKVPVTTWKAQENHVRWASYGIIIVLAAIILGLAGWWFYQPSQPEDGPQDLIKLLNNVASPDKRLQVPPAAPSLEQNNVIQNGSRLGSSIPESSAPPAINSNTTTSGTSSGAAVNEATTPATNSGTTRAQTTPPGSAVIQNNRE